MDKDAIELVANRIGGKEFSIRKFSEDKHIVVSIVVSRKLTRSVIRNCRSFPFLRRYFAFGVVTCCNEWIFSQQIQTLFTIIRRKHVIVTLFCSTLLLGLTFTCLRFTRRFNLFGFLRFTFRSFANSRCGFGVGVRNNTPSFFLRFFLRDNFFTWMVGDVKNLFG